MISLHVPIHILKSLCIYNIPTMTSSSNWLRNYDTWSTRQDRVIYSLKCYLSHKSRDAINGHVMVGMVGRVTWCQIWSSCVNHLTLSIQVDTYFDTNDENRKDSHSSSLQVLEHSIYSSHYLHTLPNPYSNPYPYPKLKWSNNCRKRIMFCLFQLLKSDS